MPSTFQQKTISSQFALNGVYSIGSNECVILRDRPRENVTTVQGVTDGHIPTFFRKPSFEKIIVWDMAIRAPFPFSRGLSLNEIKHLKIKSLKSRMINKSGISCEDMGSKHRACTDIVENGGIRRGNRYECLKVSGIPSSTQMFM